MGLVRAVEKWIVESEGRLKPAWTGGLSIYNRVLCERHFCKMVSQNIRTAALHLIETHLVSGWASEQTSKKERGDSIEPYRLNFMYVNVCASNIRLCLIAWHAYVWIFSTSLCAVFFKTPLPLPPRPLILFLSTAFYCIQRQKCYVALPKHSHSRILNVMYATEERERERRKTVNGRITPSTAAFSHYLQYLLCLSPVCYFSRVCLCSCMSVFCTSHSRSPTPDHFLCHEIRFTIPTHTHSHTHLYIYFLFDYCYFIDLIPIIWFDVN